MWDKLFGLHLFPLQKLQQRNSGITWRVKTNLDCLLDSRRDLHKIRLDYLSSTFASSSHDDFEKFIDPIYKYATKTPTRVPLCFMIGTKPLMAGRLASRQEALLEAIFIKVLEAKMKKKLWTRLWNKRTFLASHLMRFARIWAKDFNLLPILVCRKKALNVEEWRRNGLNSDKEAR